MSAEEAATILVTLNESSEQLDVTDTEWSDTWNIELDSLFKIQSLEPATSQASEKKTKSKRITTHRILTSPEIIKEKRDEELQRERKEKEKEERKRKREESKRMKEENKKNLKLKPKKPKQTNEEL